MLHLKYIVTFVLRHKHTCWDCVFSHLGYLVTIKPRVAPDWLQATGLLHWLAAVSKLRHCNHPTKAKWYWYPQRCAAFCSMCVCVCLWDKDCFISVHMHALTAPLCDSGGLSLDGEQRRNTFRNAKQTGLIQQNSVDLYTVEEWR